MQVLTALSSVLLICSTLLLGTSHAQSPPDAGALRQQIERERLAPPAPESSAPLQTHEPAPLSLPDSAQLTVKSFQFVGHSLLDAERLQAVVRPWLDRPVGFSDLQRAARAVAEAFRAAGWLVSTHLPQQDVTEGVITIQIVESRFSGARIEGADATQVRPAIALRHVEARQQIGQPLSAPALDRALLLVNDLPGISASGALAPGDAAGETQLLLRLSDERWFDGVLRVDNEGARSTGDERALLTMALNSPFGIGDRVRGDLLHSDGSDYLRLGYTLPIGADGWQLGVNASRFEYDLVGSQFAALNGEGTSMSFGVDGNYPLLRSRLRNLYLTLALNERSFRNEALNVRQSDYDVTTWSVGLAGNFYDRIGGGGANSFTLSWVGGRLRHGTLDLGENPQVAGTFNKLLYGVSRQQLLTSTLSLHAALNGQFSNERLDSSERMYLGGPEGVRAYPVNDAGGARSELIAVELHWLAHSSVTALAFNDWGHVHNRGAEADYTLRGYGLALQWRAPLGIDVEATYALRDGDNPNPSANGTYQDGSRHRNRWWLGATLAF